VAGKNKEFSGAGARYPEIFGFVAVDGFKVKAASGKFLADDVVSPGFVRGDGGTAEKFLG
jgi:hypothetical protein